MKTAKRNLVEDMLMLRVKWQPDSEYPLKIQAAWLEAVERAIAAEAKVDQLTQKLNAVRDATYVNMERASMAIDYSQKKYWTVDLLKETLKNHTVIADKEKGNFELLWQAKLDCEKTIGGVIRPVR